MANNDQKNTQPYPGPSYGVGAGIPTINVPLKPAPGEYSFISPRQAQSPYWRSVTGSLRARGSGFSPGYYNYGNANDNYAYSGAQVSSDGKLRDRKRRTPILILVLIIFAASIFFGLYPNIAGLKFSSIDTDEGFFTGFLKSAFEILLPSDTIDDTSEKTILGQVVGDLETVKSDLYIITAAYAVLSIGALTIFLSLLISLLSKHCSRIALKIGTILAFLGSAGIIVGLYLFAGHISTEGSVDIMKFIIGGEDYTGISIDMGAYILVGCSLLNMILSFFAFKKLR
ncbi:MAG: hypothetical protein LBF12_05590 [Christensenellaceae bacterium]|jgi:hypothetical protein|nr:hypothetical protein [Christensenellaceae bacterium]